MLSTHNTAQNYSKRFKHHTQKRNVHIYMYMHIYINRKTSDRILST